MAVTARLIQILNASNWSKSMANEACIESVKSGLKVRKSNCLCTESQREELKRKIKDEVEAIN